MKPSHEIYQIVILAGGSATRLLPLTGNKPKSLVCVANRPFIFWQLDLLIANAIDEVVLCVGILGDQIEAALGHSYEGLAIKYAYEEPDHLFGTAGAIKNAEHYLNSSFGVLYGDSYLEMDYRDVFDAHKKAGKSMTMSVWKNDNQYEPSNASLSEDGKRVAQYMKGGHSNNFKYIDYGFSVLNKDIISSRIKSGAFAALDGLQRALSQENRVICGQ